ALSSAQVFPDWTSSTQPCNDFALNGHYPLTGCLTPRVHFSDLHQSRVSPTDSNHLLCMPCSLPRRIGTGACWFLPCPRGLPRSSGGSASTSSLSRPAQAPHALRPAQLLAHHTWALSRGSARAGSPLECPQATKS